MPDSNISHEIIVAIRNQAMHAESKDEVLRSICNIFEDAKIRPASVGLDTWKSILVTAFNSAPSHVSPTATPLQSL